MCNRLAALALLAVIGGCASNPTPHPVGGDAGGGGYFADAAAPDSATGGPADDSRRVCEDLGGDFSAGVCELEVETALDTPPQTPGADGLRADVVGVDVAGDAGGYTFTVTIQSDDTGCQSYADWWEVLALDGTLRYRRLLTHSHVDEQPFSRDGGPVPVSGDDVIIVRAHRHPEGYVGDAWLGTVNGGFTAWRPPEGFAATVAEQEPLPQGCDR